MKDSKKRLAEITVELAEAKDVVRVKKRELKKIKGGTLEAENAKRELETIKSGLKAMKDRQELIVEEFKERNSDRA
jgi:hypothetical protein